MTSAAPSWRLVLARNPDFAKLYIASLISLFGDWFSLVAASDVITASTGQGSTAAFAYAAMVLPVFLASPIAGLVADRFSRRTIMLLADAIRVPLALALIAAPWAGGMWLVIALMVVISIVGGFAAPAASAALPNLVGPDDLQVAQTMMSAAWGVMLVLGAAIGGIVSGAFGHAVAFAVDAATFALSFWFVLKIKGRTEQPRDATKAALPPLLPLLRRSSVIRRLLLGKLGVSCANGTVGLLPGLATLRFGVGHSYTGILLAARGIGVTFGPPLARRLLPGVDSNRAGSLRAMLIVCASATFIYAASYSVVATTSSLLVMFCAVAIAHLGGGAQWAMSSIGLLQATPDEYRGRIMATDYGVATLAIGISAIAAGVFGMVWSIATVTIALCGLATVVGLVWLVWCIPLLRRQAASSEEPSK